MKILYVSCHEVLEFDELRMLAELGFDFFSVGTYLQPDQPAGLNLRPPIGSNCANPDDLAAYHSIMRPGREFAECVTSEFLQRFDAVIVMHKPAWVEACLKLNSGVPIIWRTIGQSSPEIERRMRLLRRRGLKIVRFSPKERFLDEYCGHDAIIRFGKSASDFEHWRGGIRRIVSFANRMKRRGPSCSYSTFRQIVEPFECDLYGSGNEDVPELWRGTISYSDQLRVLNRYRLFVYTGTFPASYTLSFAEAWMAGIPLVAIGPRLWMKGCSDVELYEVPELIHHGIDGFVSDNIDELQSIIAELKRDDRWAAEVSSRGRAAAETLFGASAIRAQWAQFLKRI